MNAYINKLDVITKELSRISGEVAGLKARTAQTAKDPCIDWDDELHASFDAFLIETGNGHLKEDEPCYNESFNNWVDGILRDEALGNYLQDHADDLERLELLELYAEDITEALESLEDALQTVDLMVLK